MGNVFRSVLAAAKAVLQQKTVTASTSNITVQPDYGYDGLSEVIVEPTPSTAITPSDSSPVAMTSGQRYTPGANGYAIESYQNITPSADGSAFSQGINKMSGSGYAYSAKPSSGYTKGWNTETELWHNPNPTNSFNATTVTLSKSIEQFTYLRIRYKTSIADTDSSYERVFFVHVNMFTRNNVLYYAMMYYASSSQQFVRYLRYSSSTSIIINGAYRVNSTGNVNSMCIPLEIVGLK